MDIKWQVGEAAGKVWHVLSSDGPQSLTQLKKKIKEPSEVVSFAVGWLAREDKIELSTEKKSYRVTLK